MESSPKKEESVNPHPNLSVFCLSVLNIWQVPQYLAIVKYLTLGYLSKSSSQMMRYDAFVYISDTIHFHLVKVQHMYGFLVYVTSHQSPRVRVSIGGRISSCVGIV